MASEKTLKSPLDCRAIKPVNLKGHISPDYSLEGLLLKLKLQYLVHLIAKIRLFGKDPDAGKV